MAHTSYFLPAVEQILELIQGIAIVVHRMDRVRAHAVSGSDGLNIVQIMKKLLSTVIASLIATMLLVGCGGEKTVPTDDYTETSPDTETSSDIVTDALEQYAAIVSQPDAYEFDGVDPTGNYRYALVQMSAEDSVPTLIVEQETTDLYCARLFRYDPNTGAVIQPEGNIYEGTASMGGYRGTLSIMKDGNGLRLSAVEAGNGDVYVYRIHYYQYVFHDWLS